MKARYAKGAIVDRRPMMVWATIAILASAVVSLIMAVPLAQSHGHDLFAFTVNRAFSVVCHQLPERSFYLSGHPFAVCARCMGLYSGIAVAACFYPLVRSLERTDSLPTIWLFVAAAPMTIDVSLDHLDIWHNTHFSRFLTGTLLGAATMFYIVPGLIKLTSYIPKKKIKSRRQRI